MKKLSNLLRNIACLFTIDVTPPSSNTKLDRCLLDIYTSSNNFPNPFSFSAKTELPIEFIILHQFIKNNYIFHFKDHYIQYIQVKSYREYLDSLSSWKDFWRKLLSVPDQRFAANVREKVDGRRNEEAGVRGTARARGWKSDVVVRSKPTLPGSVQREARKRRDDPRGYIDRYIVRDSGLPHHPRALAPRFLLLRQLRPGQFLPSILQKDH